MNNLQSVQRAIFEQKLDEIFQQIDVLETKLEKVSFNNPPTASSDSPLQDVETNLTRGLRLVAERLQNIINNLSL